MNSDKAYLLGLILGGGIWSDAGTSFRIRLPFKQWGSYLENPTRAGQISRDILRVVGPMFQAVYGLNISYEATTANWTILCDGSLAELQEDMERYHIPCEGDNRKNLNLEYIVPELIDDNLKRRFIAGLADTIGSTNPNHRRFSSDCQILSFEITGFKFNAVCSLCKLLHSIRCYPDQILWNHPNFHCGNDPYSTQWKKGFKLRVLADQYDQFGAFAFTSKAASAQENLEVETAEQAAEPCETRTLQHCRPTCYHPAENDINLPQNVRGGHYLHNRHVCAVLGCEHAPYDKVQEMLADAHEVVNPFPILSKEKAEVIHARIASKLLYSNRQYTNFDMRISEVYARADENPHALLWGAAGNNGYPIGRIMEAVNFLVCAAQGNLNGLRPRGSIKENIPNYLRRYPNASVRISRPDLLTPMVIEMGEYAAMIGPVNPDVYQNLLSIDPDNQYKLIMREITEDDLR